MVRIAKISDFEDLVVLFKEENIYNNSISPDRIAKTEDVLTIAELKDFIADDSFFLEVFESDNKPVGIILAEYHKIGLNRWKQGRNYVYLNELVVSEQYRKRGIATALITSLKHWTKIKKAQCIDLHVWQRNILAKPLYQKLGFEEKQVLMALDLSN